MPVHDWARVDAGIFHAFHLGWIVKLAEELNQNILPKDYYALLERHMIAPACDLRVQRELTDDECDPAFRVSTKRTDGPDVVRPPFPPTAEADLEFYRRKQNRIGIRHASDDRVVAMIEIVSPGNKSTRNGLRAFVEKAAELMDQRVHLLIIDLFPPGPRDPNGIHAAIWENIAGQEYALPAGKPLTLAAYETDLTVCAYVEHVAVGDALPDMPLFLEPNGCVQAPLEATYRTAFAAMPHRWRRVLLGPAAS